MRVKLSKLLEQFPELRISSFILFFISFSSISLLITFMYSVSRQKYWYAIGKLFLSLASTALLHD